MNRQVWRDDNELMVLVNLRGVDLINAMNGQQTLIEVVDQVYCDGVAGLDITQLEDLQQFGQIDDYEARYLETSSFIINLWTKGLITFNRQDKEDENGSSYDILNELLESRPEFKVEQIIIKLEEKYSNDVVLKNQIFHKVQLKLLSLLVDERLAPKFTGTIGEQTDKGSLAESINPQLELGYIKPNLFDAISNTNTSKATTVGMTIAMGGVIITVGTVAKVGTTAGRTVGEWESGQ